MCSVTVPLLDDRDLAAAGLVHRRVALAAGRGAGGQHVAAQLGALAGQRRREDLERVAGRPPPPRRRSARADDRDGVRLVQAQQLGEPQLEPAAMRAATASVGRGLAALDLREHRGADAASARPGRAGEVHRLAQRAHARPDVDLLVELRRRRPWR